MIQFTNSTAKVTIFQLQTNFFHVFFALKMMIPLHLRIFADNEDGNGQRICQEKDERNEHNQA